MQRFLVLMVALWALHAAPALAADGGAGPPEQGPPSDEAFVGALFREQLAELGLASRQGALPMGRDARPVSRFSKNSRSSAVRRRATRG